MTLSDIAGYCPEKAIWKMLVDVTGYYLGKEPLSRIGPECVVIAGEVFLTMPRDTTDHHFMAPEADGQQNPAQTEIVWSIGALIYYASTGRILFGGHGGSYQRQHPTVSLPVLPKTHQSLTPIMQRCLCDTASKRICMEELNEEAKRGLLACSNRKRKVMLAEKEPDEVMVQSQVCWPEEMKEV